MIEKARSIRLLAMDVDGVLTAGEVIYTDTGVEMKAFDIHDGLGIAVAGHAGLMTAVVTGRVSPAVERRARELGVTELRTGRRDKGAAVRSLITQSGLQPDQVAFIGDDINDLPAFRECGFRIAVENACKELKAEADYVTRQSGGRGAVRETIELILESQGKWTAAVEAYLQSLEQTDARSDDSPHQ